MRVFVKSSQYTQLCSWCEQHGFKVISGDPLPTMDYHIAEGTKAQLDLLKNCPAVQEVIQDFDGFSV